MTPFDGLLVWIHDIPQCDGGDLLAIVNRIKDNGLAGALIKNGDGDSPYGDPATIAQLGQLLEAANLRFLTWSYHYNGWSAEARAVVQNCRATGSTVHVIDSEIEMEKLGRPDLAADSLVQTIRSDMPELQLAYSPIGSIRDHLRAPYRQFTDAGLPMLPQTYWAAFEWDEQRTMAQFYADVATYSLESQPIYPAYIDAPLAMQNGHTLGTDLASVLAFCADAKAQGATGISVWDYQNMDAEAWQRAAQAAQQFPAAAPEPDWKTLYEDAVAQLAEMNGLCARYHAALSNIQAAAQTALS